MIKGITDITDISVIDQNQSENLYSLNSIDYDSTPIGEGAFGAIHKVYSIDGKSIDKYVLKIISQEKPHVHAYTTIKILHGKIKQHQLLSGFPVYHEFPELLGLPFLVFYGKDTVENKIVLGLLMYDLTILGYEDYGKDTEQYLAAANSSVTINDKLYLAYQLTKVFSFLHSILFIHSDFSEASIFFNPDERRLALIDFDSGFNFDKQVKATTIGKLTRWLSGGWSNVLSGKINVSKFGNIEKIAEENFLLTSAVFQLIFDVMPYFFLIDNEDETKRSYLRENKWPEKNIKSPSYNVNNRTSHEQFLDMLSILSDNGFQELIEAFNLTFNEGYSDSKKRLKAKELKEILRNYNSTIENTPAILNFSSDKIEINKKGEFVQFVLKASGYNRIFIDNQLFLIGQNSKEIQFNDSADVILRVENDFGAIEEKIHIKAIKINPAIHTFQSSKLLRDTADPIVLTWQTENAYRVEINDISQQLLMNGTLEVFPKEKMIYRLNVYGNFDQVVSQELELDVVRPTIKHFDWKINLDKGIDNVDLTWATEDAVKVIISPRVGVQDPNGIYHIGIADKTVFELTAVGILAETKKDIEAVPFPIPLIEKFLVPEPVFTSNVDVNITITDIVTRIPIEAQVEIDPNLFKTKDIEFVIQKLPIVNNPEFVNADFEILPKARINSIDKILRRLKYLMKAAYEDK